MKRYLLFSGYDYYPNGGWADLVDTFDTVEDARKKAFEIHQDWYQIVDRANGIVVEKF